MGAIGDVYQVTVQGTFVGQEWNTVYYYEQRLNFVTTDPTYSQTVAERFEVQVLPFQLDLCVPEVLFDRIMVKNLYDPGDAFTLVVGEAGTGAGANAYAGTFEATGFELQGETEITRRGAKRIPGVQEASMTNGIITDAGFISVCQDFADALTTWISVGTIIFTDTFAPVIVKRVRTGTPGAYFYRLPTTLAESVVNTITDVLLDLLVTSQNSRKVGVGS